MLCTPDTTKITLNECADVLNTLNEYGQKVFIDDSSLYDYLYLFFEAVCCGAIKELSLKDKVYEINVEVLETSE